MSKRPCYECPDRYPACHDTCEKHKLAAAKDRARKRPVIIIGTPEDAIVGYLAQKRK